MASEAGVSSAPATPCAARATINDPSSHATAQRTEVTAKATTPITKTRFCPKRSPSEPPTRMSEPSVRR